MEYFSQWKFLKIMAKTNSLRNNQQEIIDVWSEMIEYFL